MVRSTVPKRSKLGWPSRISAHSTKRALHTFLLAAFVATLAAAAGSVHAHNAGVSSARIVVEGRTVEVEINALGRDFEQAAGVRIAEKSGEINPVALSLMTDDIVMVPLDGAPVVGLGAVRALLCLNPLPWKYHVEETTENVTVEVLGNVAVVTSERLSVAAPETAARLSLVAYVRHTFTDYDELLAEGYDHDSARHFVAARADEILQAWGVRRRLVL